MKKRGMSLNRRGTKRVCECGGELELVGVDGAFMVRARCVRCGEVHVGTGRTKEAGR